MNNMTTITSWVILGLIVMGLSGCNAPLTIKGFSLNQDRSDVEAFSQQSMYSAKFSSAPDHSEILYPISACDIDPKSDTTPIDKCNLLADVYYDDTGHTKEIILYSVDFDADNMSFDDFSRNIEQHYRVGRLIPVPNINECSRKASQSPSGAYVLVQQCLPNSPMVIVSRERQDGVPDFN